MNTPWTDKTKEAYQQELEREWNDRAPDFLEAAGGTADRETVIESFMEFVCWSKPLTAAIEPEIRRQWAEEVFTDDEYSY